MTKIINLFAGPGAGKSTTAAGLFYLLKIKGINCELVTEYAKDLTWAQRHDLLAQQDHVFTEQYSRIDRVHGQVDFIITDSPLLLGLIYATGKFQEREFREAVLEKFHSYDNVNYFLTRSKDYLQVGRNQTLAQAQLIDHQIKELLQAEKIGYCNIAGNADAPYVICTSILKGTT